MNQNLKTSQVIFIIILFGSLLFAKFWASFSSSSVSTFSYMHSHPDGSIYLKLNNQLYGFDQQGKHQQSIDLAKMQVQETNLTDFAFFSNGDLLLRQQIKGNNFIENLQRYLRFKKPTDKISTDNQDGLFRCNTLTYQCAPFAQQALNLHDAFAITIDWPSDRVIVADSSRHSVYLFSADGKELDSLANFKFPNQVQVVNNKLYVANTNFHRLSVFDLSDNNLGKRINTESFDTRTQDSRLSRHVWPASLLILDKERWIINMNNDMAYGGIYIFNDQGEFIKQLQLPSAADPFELIQMGKQILITDFSLDRIYLYSLKGKLQGEFKPVVFQKRLSELIERRLFYKWLDTLFSILFALSLTGGFVLALYQQYQSNEPETSALLDNPASGQEAIVEPILYWVKPSTRTKVMAIVIMAVSVMLLLILAISYWIKAITIVEFFMHTWRAQLLILLALLIMLLELRRKIGITENTVIIQSPLGSNITCLKSNIISNDDHIVIGKAAFQIDQLYKLFSEQDVENYLYPAIKAGRQVDNLQMQALLNRNTTIRIARTLTVVILLGLYFYYGVL